MILPLPPMYGEVMAACATGLWRITEYDGAGFNPGGEHRYTGVVAIRGDIRIQVEWGCAAVRRQPAEPWHHRGSSIAVRHPDHDPADFGRTRPARWFAPATADADRRRDVPAVWSAVRLLTRDPAALTEVVLNAPRPRRRAGARR